MLAFLSHWDTTIHSWFIAHGAPLEDFAKLIVAGIAGGLVGLERELRGRQAGFRTNMLVCIGSALVMIVSAQVALYDWPSHNKPGVNINVDPARIAYGVMGGIGFLGAGVIIHHKGAIRGLTTAAGLWCVAAMGLAAGMGMYTLALLSTILIVAALCILDKFEDFLPKLRYRSVTVRTRWRPGCVAEAVKKFKAAGLRVTDVHFDRDEDISFADIHMRITFINKETYFQFERQLSSDSDYQLMAAREV
jgi:putative Mg2+ transporter-C (MgtC) family protein